MPASAGRGKVRVGLVARNRGRPGCALWSYRIGLGTGGTRGRGPRCSERGRAVGGGSSDTGRTCSSLDAFDSRTDSVLKRKVPVLT